MHKNSMFFYISPSFIGAGAPCPPPHRSTKAYIGTKERDYDILVSLCLSFSFPFSFSFLSFPFLPSFFFFFGGGGGGPGHAGPPPWIRACCTLWPMGYKHPVVTP